MRLLSLDRSWSTMHVTTGIVIFTFLGFMSVDFSHAKPTTSQITVFVGPCRPWLFPCGKGSWVCTSEAAYWKFIFGPKPECPSLYPQTTEPPPGECQLVNGVCQFTEWSLKCKAGIEQFGGNKCGSMTEYVASAKSNGAAVPAGFGQYPPPNQLCLAVNGSCTWYNPCVFWRDFGTKDSVCGSADEYYAFVYGPPLPTNVNPGHIPTDPPGQCAVDNDRCDWFNCTSWLGWCEENWNCATTYDKETYFAGPPPPCPPPPPNYHPPTKPGTCRFNISSGKCSFFPNKTDCVSWVGMCESNWLCGTPHEEEVYHTIPPLPCPLPPHPPVKPGTCKFNSSAGKCSFFPNETDCVSWLGICESSWLCGTLHEEEIYRNIPPRPCPLPPHPPVKPGTCKFNSSAGKCNFYPNTSNIVVSTDVNPCNQPIYPPGYKPSCAMLEKQWTYNSSSGQCNAFAYSPCGEDREGYNVFPTQQECDKTCVHQDPCNQPIYPPGFVPRCNVLQKQWTYNSTTGQCVEFYYHPCGEDREGYDVFSTQEECDKTCVHQDPCYQPIYPPGFVPHCYVLQKQWTYNSTTGQCVEFYYHPCGEDRDGYDVFVSEEECAKVCLHRDPCKESIYPPGFIPKCTVVQKQWTYNQTSKECVEFSYRPCGEDREGYDVFTSEQECIKTCVHQDPCHQPIYPPGFTPTCRLLIKQWTYNPKSGQCVEFEYYPCGEERDGYDVFSTEKECISTCVNKDQ